MAKTMLPVLICLLYISANAQGLPENSVNSQDNRLELTVGHSSGVKEEAGKVFQANAYARGNCEFVSSTSSARNCTATVTYFNRKRVIGEHTCGASSLITPMTTKQEHLIRFLFQKDKAIFVYESENEQGLFQNFDIVEPHRDFCMKYHASMSLGSHLTHIRQMNVATYTNIIVHDNGHYDVITDCDFGGARCKYSVDGQGEKISGPYNYLPKKYQDHSVKVFPSTRSDAHFTIVSEWQPLYRDRRQPTHNYLSNNAFSSEKLLYVQAGAEETPFQLANFDYRNGVVPATFVDNSNGLFSFCRNRDDGIKYEFHCVQFDERALKFNETKILRKNEQLLAVYNLPEGGILFVKSNCQSGSTCNGLSFETWSVNSNDAKQHDLKEIPFSLPIAKAIVHVEEDNQLCITMYNESKNSPGYDLVIECFSNPFFSSGARSQNYISMTYLLTCVMMVFFYGN